MTFDKEHFNRKIPWIITIVIFAIVTVFQAGYAVATFATKAEMAIGLEQARKDRMIVIEKTMDDHKLDQRVDMERMWKKLDAIENKVDRLKR